MAVPNVNDGPQQIKSAKNAYVKALEYNKNHAKALQQLGWLHYKDEDDFRSAIEYLKRASEIGAGDARCGGEAARLLASHLSKNKNQTKQHPK